MGPLESSELSRSSTWERAALRHLRTRRSRSRSHSSHAPQTNERTIARSRCSLLKPHRSHAGETKLRGLPRGQLRDETKTPGRLDKIDPCDAAAFAASTFDEARRMRPGRNNAFLLSLGRHILTGRDFFYHAV